MPEVCAIILNWNGWQDTIECLNSLLRSSTSLKTIIVIDNASSDKSSEKILAWAKNTYSASSITVLEQNIPFNQKPSNYRFIYLQNKFNMGYAAGNNSGIRLALSEGNFDFIWILNNDTTLHERALETILAYAAEHPDTGVFGSTVVFADRLNTIQCAGGYRYNPWTTVLRAAMGEENLDRVLSDTGTPKLDYIYGASIFVRSEVFNRIGLLNEEYFLFYEELDFCHRCKKAGIKIGWCPDSIVYHKHRSTIRQQGSSEKGKLALAGYHENLSTLIYTRRFYPWFLPFTAVFRFFGKLFFILIRKEWHLIKPLLMAYRDFIKQHIFCIKPSNPFKWQYYFR